MDKYKILIFDLDDTLIDNLENVRYAYTKMIESVGEKYSEDGFKKWYEIDKNFWKDWQDGLIKLPAHLKNETGKKTAQKTVCPERSGRDRIRPWHREVKKPPAEEHRDIGGIPGKTERIYKETVCLWFP